MPKFESIVRRVIELSQQPRAIPTGSELEEFLDSLSEALLLKLEALMFLGRGDDREIARIHLLLKGDAKDKRGAIRALLGKTPMLGTYLSKGLERAARTAQNLEAEF